MKSNAKQAASIEDAMQAKRERKAEYMRRYHAKKRRAAVKALTVEEPKPEVEAQPIRDAPLESRERVYGPVIESLKYEKELMEQRHRGELEEITQGIAVLTRLMNREISKAVNSRRTGGGAIFKTS